MRIAMIGIKAIPARFGGFETAVDEISRGLVAMGHEVTVYNRSGMSTWSEDVYEGVRLVTLPTLKSKNLSTIAHAFLATLHVMLHPVDIVHFFTTGTTLFAPLVRARGMKAVCSVDGTDWQRGKWGTFARWYLRTSEWLASWWCNALISDSREVQRYYANQYQASSQCITYGFRESRSSGRDCLNRFNLTERGYVLFVGRLVPENNIHHLIKAFEGLVTDKKLVIVGDDPWEKNYVASLKATRDPRIVFTGGVYGDAYAQLQQNAYLFVLPDEVGGTHPALVEAMGFGNCVLVNDTPSNLEVIDSAGFAYRGAAGSDDLQSILQHLLHSPDTVAEYRVRASERAFSHYRWRNVIEDHERLYRSVLGVDEQAERSQSVEESADPSRVSKVAASSD